MKPLPLHGFNYTLWHNTIQQYDIKQAKEICHILYIDEIRSFISTRAIQVIKTL